eukprot:NODE_860_length_3640_cov_0.624117.p3 type:complete len:175 gc:universal NODE_860_length_3640_cov_0.624117:934-1458(+)
MNRPRVKMISSTSRNTAIIYILLFVYDILIINRIRLQIYDFKLRIGVLIVFLTATLGLYLYIGYMRYHLRSSASVEIVLPKTEFQIEIPTVRHEQLAGSLPSINRSSSVDVSKKSSSRMYYSMNMLAGSAMAMNFFNASESKNSIYESRNTIKVSHNSFKVSQREIVIPEVQFS